MNTTPPKYRIPHPKARSLPTIVRSYKSAVTRVIHLSGHLDFAWQSLYWDHIIRDEGECCRVRQYILDNPYKWWLKRRGEND